MERRAFLFMLGGSVLAARAAQLTGQEAGVRGTWGFIGKTGQTVIPPQFADADAFSEGLAAVKVENAWGYIDTAGTVVIRPQFDAAYPFSQRRAPVRIGRRTGYIDPTGAAATPMTFSTMLPFREGRAAISSGPAGPPGSPSPTEGYIDLDGTVVIAPQYERVSFFSEGLAAVARDGKAGFIDQSGAVVIPLQFERAHPFASGRAGVKINGKWGYIDRTGKIVIAPTFHFVWPFYAEGMARFDARGYWCGYIDENGKVIVGPKFEEAEEFVAGLAAAKKKRGKWGFVDRTGTFVIPAEYDKAYSFTADGVALVERGRKTVRLHATPTLDRIDTARGVFGFIDRSGRTVIPCRFAAAHDFSSGLAPVNFAGT
jgi:WG containing repeat